MKPKILFTTRLLPQGFSSLEDQFDLIFPDRESFTREELLELITDCDALVPTFQYVIDELLIMKASKRLRIIANYGVGYNNISVDCATKCGIVVTNTPDPVIEPTAEMAFALLLAVSRKVALYDRLLREPVELKWGVLENLGLSLYGKTIGIVGMGRIGKAMARRAIAFGMKVLYTSRNKLSYKVEEEYSARYVSLEDLMKESDVVSLHVPLTPDTYHLIDQSMLGLLKSTSIIINTARGSVIDEQALLNALQQGSIYGAGIDVFENEPYINPDFINMENVVLAPHNGTATIDTRNEMGRQVSLNIIRFFEGSTDITRVN